MYGEVKKHQENSNLLIKFSMGMGNLKNKYNP